MTKVAIVKDCDSTSVSAAVECGIPTEEGNSYPIGHYVIVPDHFPDEVCLVGTRRGLFARSEGFRGEEFEVSPEATPEKAWQEREEK